jgi:hypothetical protein
MAGAVGDDSDCLGSVLGDNVQGRSKVNANEELEKRTPVVSPLGQERQGLLPQVQKRSREKGQQARPGSARQRLQVNPMAHRPGGLAR